MDKDAALRKQVADEIQEQFESKLKLARREKQQAEEELESASERWRSERRKLNAEIDRLEAALALARENPRRKVTAGTTDQPAPAVTTAELAAITRAKEEADDKLRKVSDEWEAERSRLKSQISRLEGAVAEAIERSSNPMRATQSIRETFEAQLGRVSQDKMELEQAYLRAKTEWEQEKLKITGEMVKLRQAAQIMGKPVPRADAPEVNPKVKALENQLKESLAKWNAEREGLIAEIRKLDTASREWDTERRQLNNHAAGLQQAFVQADARAQSYEITARSAKQFETEIGQLKQQKDATQREFHNARKEWDAERQRLSSRVEVLEQELQTMTVSNEQVSNDVVDQLRAQYEQRLQEAIQQRTRLTQELQDANRLLESERTRLSADISKFKEQADRPAQNNSVTDEAIRAEAGRIEAKIKVLLTLINDPNTELSTIIRKNVERAELDAYLKGLMFLGGGSAF